MIYYNARIMSHGLSGVQRYLSSIINCFPVGCGVAAINSMHGGIVGHLWEQFYLPMKLRENDVLWSPSNTGPIVSRCKQIVTVHDFATLDHPEWTTYSFSTAYRFILPRVVNSCEKVIAISEYTKSRILAHCKLSEDKIVVIPNGVDDRFFYQKADLNSHVLNKYGLVGKRYILSVSSIEPRKNITSIIKAWNNSISQVDDDICLVLVGRENKTIFADSGLTDIPARVVFTGFVDDDDLPLLYKNSLMFVYVSLYEGFGLPLLEAMAAGSPVITSNNTSIPEVVGSSAVTVSPFSVSEITDAIIEVANNSVLRSKLADDGKKRASLFTWNETAKKTLECLKEYA